MDINPRPRYKDGTPAHTLSVNHGMCTYDLNKGESPLITLRPIAVKSAIGELLWIYRDQSNDLDLLNILKEDQYLFDDLYKDYKINRILAKRLINSKVDGRDAIRELLITNYD